MVAAEAPRAVYLAACDRIGVELEPLGFRYARSYPRARRRGDTFLHEVSMSSSHNNVAESYVSLGVVVSVWSNAFARWRSSQAAAVSTWDRVAGTNLGYLRDPPGYLDCNLADPGRRGPVVEDIVDQLQQRALPWFDLFEDRTRLLAAVIERSIEGLDPANAVELLVWLDERGVAKAYLHDVLTGNRAMATDYDTELQHLRQNGLARTTQYTSDAGALAYAALAHRLGPT